MCRDIFRTLFGVPQTKKVLKTLVMTCSIIVAYCNTSSLLIHVPGYDWRFGIYLTYQLLRYAKKLLTDDAFPGYSSW